MPASGTFIIAGGGLAGAKAAEALREQGFDGRVVLAAEEEIRPDERPPLSKDYLLLATGSVPRRLPLPGAEADGVLYLRNVGDSDRIRDTFTTASRVLIIGAGWIGLEVAAAARLPLRVRQCAVSGLPGSGTPEEPMEAAGIPASHIAAAARELLKD
jgi:3-phenylpropionate/trans-cinnamate dioxygenase ferredoxin reductase subunit